MTQQLLLQGKRVLVTGGGRGIGRAIALICHQQGARVAIASRTKSELQETIAMSASWMPPKDNSEECDDNYVMQLFEADVTSKQSVESMVREIKDQWGGLDILINNAGGAQKVGLPDISFYVASKFALEGLTSCWAKELADRQIVVNSISPGMIDTKSFPKAPGKAGVRSAESIQDGLLLALTASPEYSGHYLHVDELDMVRKAGLPDTAAWKPIDEPKFSVDN